MNEMKKAGSEPAYPVECQWSEHGLVAGAQTGGSRGWAIGITKRELACIELRIPATGDAELDALIARAQRRDMAAMVMQGFAADPNVDAGAEFVADPAAKWADALIAELEKAHG